MTRLRGSGTVPRAFAFAVLAIVTVFVAVWVSSDPSVLIGALVIEALAVAAAVRSLFVGVLLDGGRVRVRGWFRTICYAPGELTKVSTIPYWRFLDAKDPILSLLKFTPVEGWVREFSATVSWKDRTEAQAAEIRRHLAIEEPE
jgi:hypothetical protein